jgi:hypothetical protein
MFRREAWIRHAGIALLLLASLGMGSLGLLHADDTDVACSPMLVAHDQSAHHIASDPATTPAESEHCFLCHSLRSYYPAFDKFEQHHHGPRVERLHIAPLDLARFAAWAFVPGRAPPA